MTRHTRATTLCLTLAVALSLVVGLMMAGAPVSAAVAGRRLSMSAEIGRGDPAAYAFFAEVDGEPIHWNPCRRIGWRLNLGRAPDRARPQAREALRRVNKATGLRFRYQGRTSARPNARGRNYPRDTSLVMGWSTPRRSQLTRGQAGVGGPQWSSTGEIVTGFVLLNAKIELQPGFGQGTKFGYQGTLGQLMMHESGHAVGLDHVSDPAQILYPMLTDKRATWGAGDKNGLRQVGKRAGCF